jgi:hypothetical protein
VSHQYGRPPGPISSGGGKMGHLRLPKIEEAASGFTRGGLYHLQLSRDTNLPAFDNPHRTAWPPQPVHYDMHEYKDEKGHAFEALAQMIERIVRPPEAKIASLAVERGKRRKGRKLGEWRVVGYCAPQRSPITLGAARRCTSAAREGTTMKKIVDTIKGSQGAWKVTVEYTDGEKEVLPCAHDSFWQAGNHYCDPWEAVRHLWQTRKFQEFAALLRDKKRVVVTASNIHPTISRVNKHKLNRTGYRGGVFSIDNVQINDVGVSFDFVGTYAQRKVT